MLGLLLPLQGPPAEWGTATPSQAALDCPQQTRPQPTRIMTERNIYIHFYILAAVREDQPCKHPPVLL